MSGSNVRERRGAVGTAAARHAPLGNVLVAFDGSPASWAALDRGIAMADGDGTRLTVAGVVPEPPWWVSFDPVAPCCARATLRCDAERDMERTLAAARDHVPATLPVTTQLLHGRPARTLAVLIEAGRYDVVVLGLRRRPLLRRLLGARLVHSLLSRSGASIMAVKEPAAP